MEPKIIYEDAEVVVVNKPAGLLSHPDSFSGLILVHRLDRETSGVLVLAKNETAHQFLKPQFQARSVVKNYLAIVSGNLKEKTGEINLPIGRHPKHTFLRLADYRAKPPLREARTKYEVKESFSGYDYLSLWPKTGRTHQLRVHLKALGHPIVCDRIYAPKRECLPMMGRLALHAASLEISLPNAGRHKLETELPSDFQATLDYLRSL